MNRVAKQIKFTAIVALTILSTPLMGTDRKEEEARNAAAPFYGGDGHQHAITHNQTDQRDRTRSDIWGTGEYTRSPFDELLRRSYYGQGTEGQGQARGAVVCEHPDSYWISRSQGQATQRDGRFTRRYLPELTDPVGGKVWIRTTTSADGTRETVVRDVFGRPLYWSVEER